MSYMDMLGPEEQMQVAVVNYLKLKYRDVLFMHPAQETYTKSKFQHYKNKVMGVKKGVPDLLIFNSGRGEAFECYKGLAIELKYGKNKPTAAQDDWAKQLMKNGWLASVAYSTDEAMKIIDLYL